MTQPTASKSELIAGCLLLFGTVLALLFANLPELADIYQELKQTSFAVGFADTNWMFSKPLILWINDGLMAIFFLLVGLELKRETLSGQLSNKQQIILPGFAALGGMIIPALIYVMFNYQNPETLKGWAIPVATDIAFVLGVLALISKHIPLSLRLFLLTLAIFDDLAAILIIAFFYTSNLSWLNLMLSMVCFGVLILFNIFNVRRLAAYILVGIIMWICLLKSGVHATLTGVLLGLTIPFSIKNYHHSPLRYLEKGLQPWIYFLVLPLFAFVNAGINLHDTSLHQLYNSVTLGIVFGLFIGKQLGVFSFAWLAIRLGWTHLPNNVNWKQLYGAAILCGIGFTMSLFIASLSFDTLEMLGWDNDRVGILLGSLLAGTIGYGVLRYNSTYK